MHLNVASVAGFILCLGIIITGIATNGGIGTIMNFIHVPSMLVTFGGALFAVMITSDSFADYLDGLKSFPEAFHKVKLNEDMISVWECACVGTPNSFGSCMAEFLAAEIKSLLPYHITFRLE